MSEDQDRGEQRPVDDDGGVRFRPPITRTTRTLPFDQLPWDDLAAVLDALATRGLRKPPAL